MSRGRQNKKEEIKPIFPIKHEFVKSLDRFVHEAGMLADCAKQLLQIPDAITNVAARTILQERVDAFAQARFGDVEQGEG